MCLYVFVVGWCCSLSEKSLSAKDVIHFLLLFLLASSRALLLGYLARSGGFTGLHIKRHPTSVDRFLKVNNS